VGKGRPGELVLRSVYAELVIKPDAAGLPRRAQGIGRYPSEQPKARIVIAGLVGAKTDRVGRRLGGNLLSGSRSHCSSVAAKIINRVHVPDTTKDDQT
jgi:hypothetical protein